MRGCAAAGGKPENGQRQRNPRPIGPSVVRWNLRRFFPLSTGYIWAEERNQTLAMSRKREDQGAVECIGTTSWAPWTSDGREISGSAPLTGSAGDLDRPES